MAARLHECELNDGGGARCKQRARASRHWILTPWNAVGASLTPSSKAVFAQASEQAAVEQQDSPTKQHPNAPDNIELAPPGEEEQDVVSAHLSIPTRPMRSMPSSRTLGRGSDAWEVLTTGNASLEEITEQHYEEDTAPRAWKSANNGEKLAGELSESGMLARGRALTTLRGQH